RPLPVLRLRPVVHPHRIDSLLPSKAYQASKHSWRRPAADPFAGHDSDCCAGLMPSHRARDGNVAGKALAALLAMLAMVQSVAVEPWLDALREPRLAVIDYSQALRPEGQPAAGGSAQERPVPVRQARG